MRRIQRVTVSLGDRGQAHQAKECSGVCVHACACVHEHLATQSCSSLYDSIDSSLPGSSVHGILQARNTGVGCHFLLQGSSQPRSQPSSPALQADSLLTELQGKPLYSAN